MFKRRDYLKKRFPELLLMLSTLVIIILFFTIYLTRFFTQQRVEAARIDQEKRDKKLEEELRLSKRSYQEKMNEKISQGDFSNRIKVPLIVQTDKEWKDINYGVDESEPSENTLEINGCAITSLAMVSSYLEKKAVSPVDILEWSGNDYFEEGTGTGWHIFGDFAKDHHYQYEDLTDQQNLVQKHLKESHPVIVSVKKGYFTEVGHIMVLTGYNEEDDTYWINNPSDTEKKGHAEMTFSSELLKEEALRYWAIY